MLTQIRLKELLRYNPETGIFTRIKTAGRFIAGSVAGTINNEGYISIFIDRQSYRAHRLVWLYIYGCFPSGNIDHKDTRRSNNAINNLRDISQFGNMQNQVKAHSNNISSGLLGVHQVKGMKKYRAAIWLNGKQKHIGYFDTPEDAHESYLKYKRIYHSGCTI